MIFWREKIDLLWVSVSLNAWRLSLDKSLGEMETLFYGDYGGLGGYCGIGASAGSGQTPLHKDFC